MKVIYRAAGVVLASGSLVGVAGAAGLAGPASAATRTTECTTDGTLPTTIVTNLDVPAGASCRLYGNEVQGNVTVEGSLTAFGGKFDRNVSVTGGSFAGVNHAVTIGGNLSFLDPAVGSYNGFWPSEDNPAVRSVVTGNLSYTIDSSTAYPMYNSPLLYFGGGVDPGSPGTTVSGNFSYSDQGTGFPGHLDRGGLKVVGNTSIS